MNVLRAYRRLLGNGPLARLLAGEFVSSIGDWLYLVALLIVVWDRPDASPLVLGLVGAARVLPYVVLSVPAGIVADRYDRRLVLLATDVARGVIMLGMAVLVAINGPLLAIIGLAILATCFSAFFGPAIGAYLPRLVRDETELGPANSAWASLDSLAFVIGPAIGGLLVAAGGLTAAFVLNAVSFGVVAVVLARLPSGRQLEAQPHGPRPSDAGAVTDRGEMPTTRTPSAEHRPPAEDASPVSALVAMREAARAMAGLLVIDVVTSFAFGGLSVLTVVLAVDVLGAGEAGTGLLNAAIGLGGLVGAGVAAVVVLRRGLGWPILGGIAVLAASLAALGLLANLTLVAAALAAVALGSMVVDVVSLTLLQRSVPDAVRGRALGVLETAGVAAYAAGSLAMPLVAGALGIDRLLVATGLSVGVAGIAGVLLMGAAATQAPALSADAVRFMGLPLFAGIPRPRLEAAAAQLKPLDVRAGEAIVTQGEPADRLYVIVDGRYDVTQSAAPGAPPQRLRTMGPGELFGEIGLLTGSPRTATVSATTPGRLLALDGVAFLDLVKAGPGLTSRLLDLHRGGIGAGALTGG